MRALFIVLFVLAMVGTIRADEQEVKWVAKELRSVGGNVKWGVEVQRRNDRAEKKAKERMALKLPCPIDDTLSPPIGSLVYGNFQKGYLQRVGPGGSSFTINAWHEWSDGKIILYICPKDGNLFTKSYKGDVED